MAYIYQIVNDINQKIYIGKTEESIEKRFKEHCNESKKIRSEKRPLYDAMNKYGIEHFHVELIEETNEPEEREIFWIEQKRSFKNGYNATIGGDGRRYIDYDLVIATYKENQNISEVARLLHHAPQTIQKILRLNNYNFLSQKEVNRQKTGVIINQYTLDGKYIQTFPSYKSAAIALGKITSTSRGASSHIADVCKGKRKTAYGFKWEFAKK